jgi:GTP-binding protein
VKPPPPVVEARYLSSFGPGSVLPPPVSVEVAFAGRSNVGKSSLINALSGRRGLAKTSSTPGKTRTINFFEIRCADDLLFHLVDLPGYGYAKRSKHERRSWGPLLEGYLRERITLRAVVLLVDIRRGMEDEERDLLELLSLDEVGRPAVKPIVVVTKIDKLALSKRRVAVQKIAPKGVSGVGVSSETGEGLDMLWSKIRAALGVPVTEPFVEGAAGAEPAEALDEREGSM